MKRSVPTAMVGTILMLFGVVVFSTSQTQAAGRPSCTITSPAQDPVTITVGDSVDFQGTIDRGTAPYNVHWDFPDGNPNSFDEVVGAPGPTSIATITYSTAGTFTSTLTATDADGKTCRPDTRTVEVGGNAQPVAVNDSYTTPTDTLLSVPAPGVLENDFDSDGDPIFVFDPRIDALTTQNGTVTLRTDGSFDYTPSTGFTGQDSFSYSVQDNRNNVSETPATVFIVVGEQASINSTSQNCGLPDQPACQTTPVPEQPLVNLPGYRILAANDLGMHCGDLDHRIVTILPPFNVVHAQVIKRGTATTLPSRVGRPLVETVYSAASNPYDPALLRDPVSPVFKTNFWDTNLRVTGNTNAFDSYDPLYPDGVLDGFGPFDQGLPVPDIELFKLGPDGIPNTGDEAVALDHQNMPGITDPFIANVPQPFELFVNNLPFFIDFDFGYTVSDIEWFSAEGIPIAPFDDVGRRNSYPLMRVQAKDGEQILASVDAVLPVSEEADCKFCHADPSDGGNGEAADQAFGGSPRSGTPFTVATRVVDPELSDVPVDVSIEYASDTNILRLHDAKHGDQYVPTACINPTDPACLQNRTPVSCAWCHYTPALDLLQGGPNDDNGKDQTRHKSNSNVIHFFHGQFTDLFPFLPSPDDAQRTSGPPVNEFEQDIMQRSCYTCHPGSRTQCLRGAMFNAGVLCQDCHGQLTQVGDDFSKNVSPSNPGAFIVASDYYDPASPTPRVPWANEPTCGSCHTGDALSNLAGDPNVIPAPDGIRLLQAYRTDQNCGQLPCPKLTPILPTNQRFAEDRVESGPAAGNPMLYRLSQGGAVIADLGSSGVQKSGHAGLFCEACHGNTHSEWPVLPSSGTFIANDNMASLELQGHVGTITECSTCHEPNDVSLPLGLGGPHGMHPVVNELDDRWNFQHKNFGGGSNNNCRICHGADLVGTVLSVAKDDRTVTCKNTQGSLNCVDDGQGNLIATFTVGTQVGCGLCHKQKK